QVPRRCRPPVGTRRSPSDRPAPPSEESHAGSPPASSYPRKLLLESSPAPDPGRVRVSGTVRPLGRVFSPASSLSRLGRLALARRSRRASHILRLERRAVALETVVRPPHESPDVAARSLRVSDRHRPRRAGRALPADSA